MKIKIPVFILLFLLIPFSVLKNKQTFAVNKKIVLHYFYGETCPYCKALRPKLINLLKKYPDVVFKEYEVWNNNENRELLVKMARERNENVRGVPTIIIGNDLYLGSNIVKIRRLIEKYLIR